MTAHEALLQLRGVTIEFQVDDARVSAVDDVSLDVPAGEILGLVGESGCGKTTLAMAIVGLLAGNARVSGEIRFRGADLLRLAEPERRKLRGGQIGMVFQDPLSSLDPAFSIGSQVADTIEVHGHGTRREARARAVELLREVGIPSPEQRYADPPHKFSGGMRQRVVIAAALANDPALLLADEPTTALDVTIQAQILLLLQELAAQHHTTIVLIAHDLGVVAQLCDRVCVMYAGQLVEVAPVLDIFAQPLHPYTRALLAALPTAEHAPGTLVVVDGQVPDLTNPPPGCRFAPRCPHRMPVCTERPVPVSRGAGHTVSCWLYTDASPASLRSLPVDEPRASLASLPGDEAHASSRPRSADESPASHRSFSVDESPVTLCPAPDAGVSASPTLHPVHDDQSSSSAEPDEERAKRCADE